jgi:MFS transporter, DHA3 family, macrolide efflux protein
MKPGGTRPGDAGACTGDGSLTDVPVTTVAPTGTPAFLDSVETPARPPVWWTRPFLLVWQGQLVSSLGDVVYELALGFWVLKVTGSTALMGTLMAVSTLPRILVAPFAGVAADRFDRKRLMVSMELIRGILVTLVGVAAFGGWLQVWMVFVAGATIGLCGAFFGPAIGATIPDLVPPERLVQANSAMQMVGTGSGIFGSAAGGFLYHALGAAGLFLCNGLSYLFSSMMLLCARIPRVVRTRAPQQWRADLRDGFRLAWGMRGLRILILAAAVLNFFAVTGIILFLPLFQRTEGLGPARYGVMMGCFAAGLFAGFAAAAVVLVRSALRFRVFYASSLAMAACLIAFPVVPFPLMLVLIVLAGVANAVMNALIQALVQMAVPADMRGKVFGLLACLSGGLTPLAMVLGGVLAEFVPIRPLIAGCFGVTFVIFLPLALSADFRAFLNQEPPVQRSPPPPG